MARFLGLVQGARGEASRLGSAASGIRAQAQGWDSGVKVFGSVDSEGRDVFQVVVTGGSNGDGREHEIARVVAGIVYQRGSFHDWIVAPPGAQREES